MPLGFSIPLLPSWLGDIKPDARGIRFTGLFSVWTSRSLLPFEDIKLVTELTFVESISWKALSADGSCISRLFARTFMIEERRERYSHNVLITPKDPEHLINWLKSNGVEVISKRGAKAVGFVESNRVSKAIKP